MPDTDGSKTQFRREQGVVRRPLAGTTADEEHHSADARHRVAAEQPRLGATDQFSTGSGSRDRSAGIWRCGGRRKVGVRRGRWQFRVGVCVNPLERSAATGASGKRSHELQLNRNATGGVRGAGAAISIKTSAVLAGDAVTVCTALDCVSRFAALLPASPVAQTRCAPTCARVSHHQGANQPRRLVSMHPRDAAG